MLKFKVADPVNAEGRVVTGNPLWDELIRLSSELETALTDLQNAGKDFAAKDDKFRRAKAKAIVSCSGRGKNAEERAAIADELFADERYAATLAESVSVAALERVRGRRAQLSAFQTLVSAIKQTGESVEFGQVGIGEGT